MQKILKGTIPMSYKISFVTTCKGRLHHLQKTLPRSISQTAGIDREFIILNYNSGTDLNEWIKDKFSDELDEGIIKVYWTHWKKYFHHSHAKNMGVRKAEGDIVVNLDADNYATEGFGEWLLEQFQRDPDIVCGYNSFRIAGASGRIAILREHFNKLRGYDEKFIGWGFEDIQFRDRAVEMGLELIDIPMKFIDVIKHTNKERFENSFPNVLDPKVEKEEGAQVVEYFGMTEREWLQKYQGDKYFEKPSYDYWENRGHWLGDAEAVKYFESAEWKEHVPFWDLHYVDHEVFKKYHLYRNHKITTSQPTNPRGWGQGRLKRV